MHSTNEKHRPRLVTTLIETFGFSPASFAYQFYALREHVDFVRARLRAAAAA